MKAYLYDVFHRCNSIIDWTPSACTLALSSTQKVEGVYSIKMTADDGVASYMRYDRTVDWSEFGYIVFWVYHPGWTNETGSIRLYSDGLTYSSWVFDFAAEWTEIVIDLSSTPDSSVGTLDLSNIIFVIVNQANETTPGEDYYFDFFHGKTIDLTTDITYCKVVEELYEPSYAELNIKGDSLDHFQAGLEMDIYDSDDVLSWTGRIFYPESVLVGKTKTIGKLKALGINSQENNIYRKNYTTARSSDYILKDIIDNALPGFTYDDEIDDFSALTYKYDHKTKIRKTLKYLAMLERAVLHYKPDGEIFFNKYDNLSKHPQIYSATYLKDDTVQDYTANPTDLDFIDSATLYNATLAIVSSWQGHKNVLRLQDDATADEDPYIRHNETQATAGTREFFIGTSDVTKNWNFRLYETGHANIILLQITDSALDYYDDGDVWQEVQTVANDTLYHIKVIWRVDNTWDCYVNGTKKVDNVACNNNQVSGVDTFQLRAYGDSIAYFYIDAYGDPDNDANYTVGQNASAWNQYTSHIRITSYTPVANRHVTRTPVIGAYNSKGQVYYLGKSSDADEQKYGINELQAWRDPEITNYTEAKQLGDNLLAVYSMDTQMISMLVVGKKHIQVGYIVEVEWSGVFIITKAYFLVTKRIWYPMNDICNLELTDNILTRKAFNIRVINKFYDEDAQQGYEEPDVAESTVDGTVQTLRSIAQLRAFAPIVHIVAGAPDVNYDVNDGVEIGDLYVDTTNIKAYICFSNTAGAADWNPIS